MSKASNNRLLHRRRRRFRPLIMIWMSLCVLALCQSGCWATLSELKRERRLRESLEEQFRAFKREVRKKERDRAAKQDKLLAQQSALVAKMRIDMQRMKSSFTQLEKRVKQGQGGVVEMFATLEKLQRSFQASLGQVSELQKQIKDILQKMPQSNQTITELRKKYEDLLKNQRLLAEQAIPAKLFARAEDAQKRKEYDKALKLFKTFVSRFGSHELADNAYLHIGDIHRINKRLVPAISAYDDLIRKYPRGGAVPVALLRLGQLHYKTKQCRAGRNYFRKLGYNYRRRAPKLASLARRLYRDWRSQCSGSRKRSRRRRRKRRRRRR